MNKTRSRKGNRAQYTAAYAEFGRAAMTNQITLAMAISMAGPGVELDFAMEGTYFKNNCMTLRSTGVEGRYSTLDPKLATDTMSLGVESKRSRIHGLITNKNYTGLGAP